MLSVKLMNEEEKLKVKYPFYRYHKLLDFIYETYFSSLQLGIQESVFFTHSPHVLDVGGLQSSLL